MQLGMIGLGRMGSNMVRRLIRNGHDCTVFDRSQQAVTELTKERAAGAASHCDSRRGRQRLLKRAVPSKENAAALLASFFTTPCQYCQLRSSCPRFIIQHTKPRIESGSKEAFDGPAPRTDLIRPADRRVQMNRVNAIVSSTITSHSSPRIGGKTAIFFAALLSAVATTAIAQPSPALQEKLAAVKQSVAENQQKLHQYQWTETTQLTLNGDAKPPSQSLCQYGPSGTVQKTPMSPPPPPPTARGTPLPAERRAVLLLGPAQREQGAAAVPTTHAPAQRESAAAGVRRSSARRAGPPGSACFAGRSRPRTWIRAA